MTARITTTCATSQPVGPVALRAGRGVSENCVPTGWCPAATSARSRRSSSTASASVASASCSPGRAPVSPERRCVRAASGPSPGDPRDRPGGTPIRPLRLDPAQSPPSEASLRSQVISWVCPLNSQLLSRLRLE